MQQELARYSSNTAAASAVSAAAALQVSSAQLFSTRCHLSADSVHGVTSSRPAVHQPIATIRAGSFFQSIYFSPFDWKIEFKHDIVSGDVS